MHTIARVNRVGGGKTNGLIIDYNGMINSLRKALATFAMGDRDDKLQVENGDEAGYLQDDDEGIAEYAASIRHATEFLADLRFELQRMPRGLLPGPRNGESRAPSSTDLPQLAWQVEGFGRFIGGREGTFRRQVSL